MNGHGAMCAQDTDDATQLTRSRMDKHAVRAHYKLQTWKGNSNQTRQARFKLTPSTYGETVW
jgi:hypothetical protein